MFIYLILVLAVCILVMLLSIIGVCWYFSGRLLYRRPASKPFRIAVMDISATTITLQRTKNTERPGIFGIEGATGQAILGPILSSDSASVTRQLMQSRGNLSAHTKVAWNTTVYGGELRSSLGLAIHEVSVPGTLGEMPAWFVEGKLDAWAILVHGSSATQEQGLRVFQTLADLDFPILALTYRNDEGAPTNPDRLSHLGDTEWQDLEAGVKYALAHGAQRLLLYGWSMGGTIVQVFLARSSSTSSISAVVLDSPILDWPKSLSLLGQKYSLPSFMTRITERMISMRIGISFDGFDQLTQTQSKIPLLLFHGMSDTTAPILVSDTFASTRPTITYYRVPEAEHTQCWNANPEKYEAHLRAFLRNVLGVG